MHGQLLLEEKAEQKRSSLPIGVQECGLHVSCAAVTTFHKEFEKGKCYERKKKPKSLLKTVE